jgi:heat-inducible transcriptional repressor
LARHEHFYQQLMKLIEKILAWEYNSKVYLGGTVNILEQPEFSDVKKVKSLLALLEEEKILQEVLASGSDVGITVKIGKENYYEAMEHCSLITATYKLKGKVIGTFGVLGPTRMEYAKVISIVEFLTMVLTEKLCKVEGE